MIIAPHNLFGAALVMTATARNALSSRSPAAAGGAGQGEHSPVILPGAALTDRAGSSPDRDRIPVFLVPHDFGGIR